MHLALIGAGRIGAVHAETLVGLAGGDGVLIADADRTLAARLADKVGARAVDTVDDLLASKPAGVVIGTPTATHASLIHAALAAGVPVFCEKPVAPDVGGTEEVLAAVRQAGGRLQVGFQRRFDPAFQELRRAVHAGELGWLHTVRSCTSDPAPPPAGYIAGSGGIFRDCAVHDFDSVRWVTGREVVRVSSTGANRGAEFFREYGDVDTAVTVLTLDDGTLGVCTATRYNGAGYDVRFEAHGSTGAMAAGHDEHLPIVPAGRPASAGAPYQGFSDRFRTAYAAELAAFVEFAEGRRENPCTGEDALAALRVAEAAARSLAEGRPVDIEEVRP